MYLKIPIYRIDFCTVNSSKTSLISEYPIFEYLSLKSSSLLCKIHACQNVAKPLSHRSSFLSTCNRVWNSPARDLIVLNSMSVFMKDGICFLSTIWFARTRISKVNSQVYWRIKCSATGVIIVSICLYLRISSSSNTQTLDVPLNGIYMIVYHYGFKF